MCSTVRVRSLIKVWYTTTRNFGYTNTARPVGGGGGVSRGSNEPPLEVNNGGLITQTVDFQLLANSGGRENKFLSYPAKKR